MELLKHAVLGTSMGAGAVVAYALWEIARSQPLALVNVVHDFGAGTFIGACGLFIFDRRFGQTVEATRESAKAQQALADSVQQLVNKDDRRAQEQDLMLATIAGNTEKLLARLAESEKARGAGA